MKKFPVLLSIPHGGTEVSEELINHVCITDKDLFELYRVFYQDHPFVRLQPLGTWPSTQQVRGSNYCDLGFKVDEERGRVIVVSAIDNLTRGASGLAVHNFNLMMGFPETLGLDVVPLAP